MLAATTLLVLVLTTHVASYKVKTPPLTTDWTDSVGEHPWPEYPRPQMIRERWLTLNGIWTYRNASAGDIDNVPSGPLDHEVLIPSCLESGLSGIMAPVTPDSQVKYSWFHTTFDVPADWHEDNVVINFGAVDYEATVFVNGHKAVFHRGGYTRFSEDITKWLNAGSANSLAVFVFDPTDTEDHIIPSERCPERS
jgi:beta-galactosidase/beta-glucuronidase